MAAPNIVGVTTIVGITTVVALTTGSSTILSNPTNSNSVYKVNTILAGNKTGSTASVSVYYNSAAAGAGTTFALANSIDIVTKSSLVVLDKASSFYLEENKSMTALASANSAIDLIVSYETIQ
jgi:hypothetical protein